MSSIAVATEAGDWYLLTLYLGSSDTPPARLGRALELLELRRDGWRSERFGDGEKMRRGVASSARSSCAGSEHTEEVQLEGTGEGLIDSSILENGNCCAVGS